MKDEAGEVSLLKNLSTHEYSKRPLVSSLIPPPSSLRKWLLRICRYGLAALFLFTAAAKLWIIKAADHRFSDNLAEFDQCLLEAMTWISSRPRG